MPAEATFKHWITRTILIAIILFSFVFALDYYWHKDLLTHTILGATIVLLIGLIHEGIHYLTAKKLGYVVKWYRTRFTMGFEIEHTGKIKDWKRENAKNMKKIGMMPYFFLLPLSFIILAYGIWSGILGLEVAGVGSLLLQGISLPMEGRETK